MFSAGSQHDNTSEELKRLDALQLVLLYPHELENECRFGLIEHLPRSKQTQVRKLGVVSD